MIRLIAVVLALLVLLAGCRTEPPPPQELEFDTSPFILRGEYQGEADVSTIDLIPADTLVDVVASASYIDEETYDVSGTITFRIDPPLTHSFEGRVRGLDERYLQPAVSEPSPATLEGALTGDVRWDLSMFRFHTGWEISLRSDDGRLAGYVTGEEAVD